MIWRVTQYGVRQRGDKVAVVVEFDKSRREGIKSALDRLGGLVADDLIRVNQVIVDKMDSPVALIPQLAGHIGCGR